MYSPWQPGLSSLPGAGRDVPRSGIERRGRGRPRLEAWGSQPVAVASPVPTRNGRGGDEGEGRERGDHKEAAELTCLTPGISIRGMRSALAE